MRRSSVVTVLPQSDAADKRADPDSNAQTSQPNSRSAFGWGLVDQVLSSATNFGGSVLAARALSSSGFGAVAIGFSVFLLVLGISRAWSSEPLVIRYSASLAIQRAPAISRAAGSSVAIGILAGVLLAAVAFALDGTLRAALLVLAISLPFLALQDLWRFALIMQGRQRSAAANDGLWLLIMLLAFAIGTRSGLSPAGAIASWTVGAVVAAGLGVAQLRCRPSRGALSWWAEQRDLGARFALEFLLVTGVAYALTIGVAAIGGLDDSAGLRGATVLMGPLNILFLGVGIQVLPLMVRDVSVAPSRLWPTATRTSVGLSAAAAVWGLALILVPDGVGQALLGDSWAVALPLLPVFTWMYVAAAAGTGALYGIRALADAKRGLRVRLALSPFVIAAGVIGVAIAGPIGGAIGLATVNSIAIPIWWISVQQSIRHRGEQRADPAVGSIPGAVS
jgi:O-antigen/teichoic acid export membrane protein